MKKIALLLCALMVLTLACGKAENPEPSKDETAKTAPQQPDPAFMEALSKIKELARNKEFDQALTAIDEAITQFGIDEFYGIKAQTLHQAGKEEEALVIVDEALKLKKGERKHLLPLRHDILLGLNRIEEAVADLQTMDSENEKKSPWTFLTIANDYMKLNQPDEALQALGTAVERGLITKSALLEQEDLKPLFDTEGFKSLMGKIDQNIGLGAPAKAFTLKDIQEQDVSLDLLKGKVVLIDFWATWCPPCREEIPNLKSYYSEYKEKGFEIVGISLDKDRAALDKYIGEQGITWRICYSGNDWKDETAALYGVNSIPSTWLVDRKGTLRHFDLRGEQLKATIADLLNEN